MANDSAFCWPLWDFTDVFDSVTVFLRVHFDSCLCATLPKQWLFGVNKIYLVTKQIKTPKKVGIFLEKYPWWSPVLISSQDSIIDAGHRHWHIPWTFFQKTQPVEHTEVVYLTEKLCCIVFQNTYERTVTLEIARRKCARKNPFQ